MRKWFMPLGLMALSALAAVSDFEASAAAQTGMLGDLRKFEIIAGDTLKLIGKGQLKDARKRITDFETAWDKAEPELFARDKKAWSAIDDAADAAIGSLRAPKPTEVDARKTVSALIDALKHPATE